MQNVSCPSCGAPVSFRSHASVMAVCEFCRACVLKEAGAVRDLGKMSEVLEDYSPIQVGTSGEHGGRSFTVVGRIQLRYDAAMWNEWYVLYDDGAGGWLSDASSQYVLTAEQELKDDYPAFDAMRPGGQYRFGLGPQTLADRRVATCTGGQGELPFRVGAGWQARVADFRRESQFATLDYSDGDKPLLYSGFAVTLPGLKAQLLRDDEQIKASAGRYRGRVESLLCPSCGTAIGYQPGMATNLVCPACQTRLDASTPQVQVLAKGEEAGRVQLTIPLGATARINGQELRVSGVMQRMDDEGSTWFEYLLFDAKGGLLWLVETDEGWQRSQVLDTWPTPANPVVEEVMLDKLPYRKLYGYEATVLYAAGAFNWRVAAGDKAQVVEYERGTTRLSAELTADELTWSRSTPVADDQVRTWFGKQMAAPVKPHAAAQMDGGSGSAAKFTMWLIALNLVPLLFNFGTVLFFTIIGLVLLWLPLMLTSKET
ncbi:DUF4178 domain-containing protein [Massilia sp. YIM B02769]|uniref:DUF4178 domain-containing protein n=1 Tax=Massilia sp. YIM B02769 TaxID=3050129 RepID=UPI0025B6C0D1|nr:DUF4178 domain-containing protein [Massilia sp. YIM B02769]MDN4059466.1 DUF4178 domain-containing protein [Massilia sp. YIM B02769]